MTVRNPEELYELDSELPELSRPVLLHSLDGFVDAGSTGQLIRDHILDTLEHRIIGRFDVDSLMDYRARRPVMVYDQDHWESYEPPELAIHLASDAAGVPFLFLTGPEPDFRWPTFIDAVVGLTRDLKVRTVVGLGAFPAPTPIRARGCRLRTPCRARRCRARWCP